MTFLILMFESGILEGKPEVAYLGTDDHRTALKQFDEYKADHPGYYLYYLAEIIVRERT